MALAQQQPGTPPPAEATDPPARSTYGPDRDADSAPPPRNQPRVAPPQASPEPRRTRQPDARQTDRIAPVLRVLAQHFDEVEFTDAPLTDVLDWLRDRGPINVIVMWRTLEDVAVDRETPVSLELSDVTVKDVLSELCAQLSPEGDMGFQAHGNTIRFAAQSYFDRILYTRTYELSDLSFYVPDFAFEEKVAYGPDSPFDRHIPTEERLAMFADVIRGAVAPELWEENGGPCTIRIWQTSLIIRAPISVHERIGGPFRLP
ncbi:MAG TPA: hypothetical protein P5572_08350 [Phycisphaerae bacterium]|nr:hypothetical protein [Phycisphaerales bacterium]HRX85014.1 hypothetical protein [Phycisphaerae bacterium]